VEGRLVPGRVEDPVRVPCEGLVEGRVAAEDRDEEGNDAPERRVPVVDLVEEGARLPDDGLE
jgi:hypothetical protein